MALLRRLPFLPHLAIKTVIYLLIVFVGLALCSGERAGRQGGGCGVTVTPMRSSPDRGRMLPQCKVLHSGLFGDGMYIDPALLGPVSALMGALIGGSTSLVAAVYTQRHQDRLQRVASEVTKRETVYADFVMSASNMVVNAYTHDEIVLSDDERRLIGLMNRMRLFAPPDVIDGAESVLRAIVEISLKPSVELRQLAKEALSKSLDPDPLLAFSLACRADLDNVRLARL
jgi:hypothetical protein